MEAGSAEQMPLRILPMAQTLEHVMDKSSRQRSPPTTRQVSLNEAPATGATVRLDGQARDATLATGGNRVVVTLATPLIVTAGKTLEVTLSV
jgi:hypothetical protein